MADRFAWFEKRRREQVSVQVILIRLAGPCAETVEPGKLLNGERIGHLETESEIVRHLIGQPLQILGTRKIVVGRVHANGLEHLGVFGQAVPLEPCLGNLAVVLVSRRSVELAEPAFVFP